MRKMLFLLFLVGAAWSGQAQLLPSYGGERAGQSAFPFLKNDLHVRSAGLAGASVALPGDAYALAQNPAGMASLKGTSVALSHLSLS